MHGDRGQFVVNKGQNEAGLTQILREFIDLLRQERFDKFHFYFH
ncbi:Uncharacterised protein [Legionella waltersii]|nr:Uncharacterised protein [Legionella waltersii]